MIIVKNILFFFFSFFNFFSWRHLRAISSLRLPQSNISFFSFNTDCRNLSLENTFAFNNHLHSEYNVILPQTRYLFQVYDPNSTIALQKIFSNCTLYIFYSDYLIFHRFYFIRYILKSILDCLSSTGRSSSPFSKNHFRSFIYCSIIQSLLICKQSSCLYLYFENHENERNLFSVFHTLGLKVIGFLPYYFSLHTSSSIVPSETDFLRFKVPSLYYTLGAHSAKRLSRIFPAGARVKSFIVGRSIPFSSLQSLSFQYSSKFKFLILLPYHIPLSKALLQLIGSLSNHIEYSAIVKLHPSHKMSYFDDCITDNILFVSDISLLNILQSYSFSHCFSLITSAALELLPIPIHILYYTPNDSSDYLPFDLAPEISSLISTFYDSQSLLELLEFLRTSSFPLQERSSLFLDFFNQP